MKQQQTNNKLSFFSVLVLIIILILGERAIRSVVNSKSKASLAKNEIYLSSCNSEKNYLWSYLLLLF